MITDANFMKAMAEHVGKRVRISGLQRRPELNGVTGTIQSCDESAVRCNLVLPGGEVVSVKPERCTLLSDDDAVDTGGESAHKRARQDGPDASDATHSRPRLEAARTELPDDEQKLIEVAQAVSNHPSFEKG